MHLPLRHLFTAIGLLCSVTATYAQESTTCGFDQKMRQLYAENPQLKADYEALVASCARTETRNGQTRTIYTIPVVFHIIHQYGVENIADEDVYEQLEILNADFRMKNADTIDVISVFDTVRADAMIEFRLATIDPNGDCTNGIEHIYSHEANEADDFSKLNQWERSRYLNIWAVRTIGDEGVAAYTYPPTYTNGPEFFADGVILLYSAFTSPIPSYSRTLTHEIAHFLALPHTWSGPQEPGTSCSDDGIADTPATGYHASCDNLYDDTCVPSVIENVQNFMNYSNCMRMFTNGQATFMRNVLQQSISQRNQLYTAETHEMTGIDVIPPPLCAPIADFSVDHRNICQGETVTYKNASWRAGVTTFEWIFPGGTPSTSTDANPTITYTTAGHHSATLVVSNAAGSSVKTFENVVYVSPAWVENIGPTAETFDDPATLFWYQQNPEDNQSEFHLVNGVGKDGSSCYMLNNYKNVSGTTANSANWYYYYRLGGTRDYLISESYDLGSTTNAVISFNYSYGNKALSLEDLTEQLRVFSSRDCGKTWQLRKTIYAEDLMTVPYVGAEDYMPNGNDDWQTATFNYNTNESDSRTRFRFEFIASDKSSNLFIDNFMISGTLGLSDPEVAIPVSIAPNPVAAGSEITVEIGQTTSNLTLELLDVNGSLVSTTLVATSELMQTLTIPMNVSKGVYFLKATQQAYSNTHKVIVF